MKSCRPAVLVGCVLAISLGAVLTAAFAQGTANPRARVVAKAYEPLPADLSVAIRYRDPSELNERLRDAFEYELKDHGYVVSEAADYVLTFETLIEEKLSADKPASVVGRGGSRSDTEVMFKLRLPLEKPKAEVGSRRYSLNASLARPGKPPIWTGSAVAVAVHADRIAVQKAMARALVHSLGKDVEAHSILIE